jgi:hypothetical protein
MNKPTDRQRLRKAGISSANIRNMQILGSSGHILPRHKLTTRRARLFAHLLSNLRRCDRLIARRERLDARRKALGFPPVKWTF